jgi:hypothetical protein
MKTVLYFAAFALGVVVVATPALAQGRNPNDGGALPEPSAAASATASRPNGKTTPQQTATYYGRNANDGGSPPEPSSAAISGAPKSQAAPQAPHLGRGANDGGM